MHEYQAHINGKAKCYIIFRSQPSNDMLLSFRRKVAKFYDVDMAEVSLRLK